MLSNAQILVKQKAMFCESTKHLNDRKSFDNFLDILNQEPNYNDNLILIA